MASAQTLPRFDLSVTAPAYRPPVMRTRGLFVWVLVLCLLFRFAAHAYAHLIVLPKTELRGADRAVTDREKSLKEVGRAVDDVASGKVSLTTIKDEVTDKTKKLAETVTDREKLQSYAKGKIAGWLQGIDDWSKKRTDDKLSRVSDGPDLPGRILWLRSCGQDQPRAQGARRRYPGAIGGGAQPVCE